MPQRWPIGDESFEVVELKRGRRVAAVAFVVVSLAALVLIAVRAERSPDQDLVEQVDDTTRDPSDDDAAVVTTPPPPESELQGALVVLSDGVLSVPATGDEIDVGPLFDPETPPNEILTVGSLTLVWRAEGDGPIVAVALGGDGPPVTVAPRGRLLASSVPGRFWLVQSKNDNITVTEFDPGGSTVAETLVPGEPLADSGRGLVVRRDDELSIWNPHTGEAVPIGPATPFVAAAGGRIVRCPERCNLIQLIGGPIPDVESVIELPGDIELVDGDDVGVIDADARRLAVAVRTAGRPHAAIVDLDVGTIVTYRLPSGDVQELAWAGRRLVAAVGSRMVEIDPVTSIIHDVMGGPDGPVDALAAVGLDTVPPGPPVLWGVTRIVADGESVFAARPEQWSMVPTEGGPLATEPFDGAVTHLVVTDRRVWMTVTRADGDWLETRPAGQDVPPISPVRLPAPAVDLATDGTRVAVLLQDGSLWLDGTLIDVQPGIAVEFVAGQPWILDAQGRAIGVDVATGESSEVASFSFATAVDTAASGGRMWVLDDAGRVLAEQSDGLFHYQSARLVSGGRALAVDGSRVLAAGADGDVWAFHPDRPVQVVARLPLAAADGAVVDLAVVGDDLWFVTAAGQLRRELLLPLPPL